MVSGSVKMTWAIMFCVLLGFALKAGSTVYFWIDPLQEAYVDSLSEEIAPKAELMGIYRIIATNWNVPFQGEFSFMPRQTSTASPGVWIDGCLRLDNAPWYTQPLTIAHLYWLVPTFAFVNALSLGQPWRRWDTLAMVLIACASYAANRWADAHVFQRGHVVSMIGATVCGVLGCMYARLRKANHVAPFVIMAPGVLFLLPSGLAISGGLTAEPDVVSLGNSTVLVSIGIAVGLLTAQAIVYLGQGKRRSALAF
jgi:uncharacterized membrane protein YjjB (DUF3815 family)